MKSLPIPSLRAAFAAFCFAAAAATGARAQDYHTETVGGYTWSYRIADGGAEIRKADSQAAVSPVPTGLVEIPATLGGCPVTGIGDHAFYLCQDMTGVAIPGTVTNIGANAFYYCINMKQADIPAGVKAIAEKAFYDCTRLETLRLPDGLETIGSWAFYGCEALESVTIPDSVADIPSRAFRSCSGLARVFVGNGVTNIGYEAFYGVASSTFYVSDIYAGPEIGGAVVGLSLSPSGEQILAGPTTVLATCTVSGATMHCTTDGTTPTAESPVFAPFEASPGTTVTVGAFLDGERVLTTRGVYAAMKIDAFTVDTAASQSTIRFAANVGATYELQRASVLAPTSDWATVDTRRAEAAGPMELTDAVPAGWTRAYYRIAAAPAPHKGVQLWADGPFWAETNLGAEKPEDAGLYFWWGDTVGYWRVGEAWVAGDGSSENFSFEEANTPTYWKNASELRSAGWTTAEGVLAPEHDAAQVQWGGGWRMPTDQEQDNLCYKCDWTWTSTNGVNGYEVRGRGDFAGNSIFLPAAGWAKETSLLDAGSAGLFWSAVPRSDGFYYSWYLQFHSESRVVTSHFRGEDGGGGGSSQSHVVTSYVRRSGYPVRPIRESAE